jgi:hypothetical protein
VYELVFKIHKNSPTIIYNFKIFSGVIPRTPIQRGREGRGKEGRKSKLCYVLKLEYHLSSRAIPICVEYDFMFNLWEVGPR